MKEMGLQGPGVAPMNAREEWVRLPAEKRRDAILSAMLAVLSPREPIIDHDPGDEDRG